MRDLLKLLIGASEKAANIARIIRSDEELFGFLVEEKNVLEKNQRFVQDFKTLGDVLIQESLRWEISKKYPEMKDNIFGEESNTFTNGLGESINIQVANSVDKTAQLLAKVMGDHSINAATTLAEEVHRGINADEDEACERLEVAIPENGVIVKYEDLGIWIDPIDATNEYIKGSQIPGISGKEGKVWDGGLHCVTILIGAFHLRSGEPIVGVVNQPFHTYHDPSHNPSTGNAEWRGRVLWGTSHPLCLKSNILPTNVQTKSNHSHSLIISSSEDVNLKAKLEKHFNLIVASGAGYKLLVVILGLADGYILSKDTTHFWDLCGPHAILNAVGGGIINFHQFMSIDQVEELTEISYSVNNEVAKNAHYANLGGIIAYRDKETLNLLRKCLK